MNYSWKHLVLNTWIHKPFHHVSERFRFHSPAVGAEHLLIILSEKTLFTALPGLTSFKKESMPFAFIFSLFEFLSQCEYLWCVPQYLFVWLWKTRDVIRSSLCLKLWLLLGREPTVWGASQKRLTWMAFIPETAKWLLLCPLLHSLSLFKANERNVNLSCGLFQSSMILTAWCPNFKGSTFCSLKGHGTLIENIQGSPKKWMKECRKNGYKHAQI